MDDNTINDKILAIKKKPKAGRPPGSRNGNYQYKERQREREKAIKELWSKGILHWKLDSTQNELRSIYYNHGNWTTLQWLTARQLGKSYLVCTIILEEAIKNPGIVMAYMGPKLKQVIRVVNAKMRELLKDCPEHLNPTYNSKDDKWTWPNGSELFLAGTDNGNAESIRGMTLNRVFIDEYCFLNDFEYVINSIIFPTMMSISDPLMVMISSPPKTADHESNKWLDEAEAEGRLIIKTVYDCPRHTPQKIERIIREQYHNDANSNAFRREMLCERIADSTRLVIPEASQSGLLKEIIKEVKRPDYYTILEAFDWGVSDKNGGLFSFIDYDNKKIIIENELWLDNIVYNTQEISDEIKILEQKTWTDNNINLITRYGDNNNPQLIIDMSVLYGLDIIATRKDGLIAAINHVRNLFKNKQIIIHPRCINLIEQIQSATWMNSDKKKFSKKKLITDGKEFFHHYDLIAALIYLVRNSNMDVNPYPENHGIPKDGTWHLPNKKKKQEDDKFISHMKTCFTIKRRR